MANPIAISSWALHRTLGASYRDSPSGGPQPKDKHGSSELPLLQLPGELAVRGYDRLELCHFHLPSREPAYLNELKAALGEAGVTLQTLLIDDGDPSDPVNADRDVVWIESWIRTAQQLGAEHARVIAGKQPWSEDARDRSVEGLKRIARAADDLRVITENWFDLLSRPEHVHDLLDRCEGEIGLCLDFGNWSGSTKYDDLAAIAPRAETCHAKCEFFDAETIDMADYGRCLELTRNANYAGPYVIVNGGKGDDEWDAVGMQASALGG